MLQPLRAVDHPRISAQRPAGNERLQRYGKVLKLKRKRPAGGVTVKGNGQSVVVVRRENKGAGVLHAQVQLHISSLGVGQPVICRHVFHPSLAAVVDGKDAAVRDIAALKAAHVEVVEAEHHAGKHLVDGHGAVSGLVAELPDGAAVALRQQYGSLLFKLHRSHFAPPPFYFG